MGASLETPLAAIALPAAEVAAAAPSEWSPNGDSGAALGFHGQGRLPEVHRATDLANLSGKLSGPAPRKWLQE